MPDPPRLAPSCHQRCSSWWQIAAFCTSSGAVRVGRADREVARAPLLCGPQPRSHSPPAPPCRAAPPRPLQVQRLTYRRRHAWATKSNKQRLVKTPGELHAGGRCSLGGQEGAILLGGQEGASACQRRCTARSPPPMTPALHLTLQAASWCISCSRRTPRSPPAPSAASASTGCVLAEQHTKAGGQGAGRLAWRAEKQGGWPRSSRRSWHEG